MANERLVGEEPNLSDYELSLFGSTHWAAAAASSYYSQASCLKEKEENKWQFTDQ